MSCASARSCEAAGFAETDDGFQTIAARLTHGSWQFDEHVTNRFLNEGFQPTGISCWSASGCVMTTLGGTMFTLHGTTWTGDYIGNPYQSAFEWEWRPNAVSCPTPDACVIVEFVYIQSPGDPEPHSEAWADVVRGGTQHLERIPDAPDQRMPMLEAVDCLDLAHCLAVGGNVASHRHLARQ